MLGYVKALRLDLDYFQAVLAGGAQGVEGAAAAAVEDGDDEGGAADHVFVPALHTAGAVAAADEGDLVAGSEDTVIAGLIAGVPAFVLALAGDGGLERDIGEVEAQVGLVQGEV